MHGSVHGCMGGGGVVLNLPAKSDHTNSGDNVKTNIDNVGGNSGYSRNILQWSKNDFKSMIYTNGHCSIGYMNT